MLSHYLVIVFMMFSSKGFGTGTGSRVVPTEAPQGCTGQTACFTMCFCVSPDLGSGETLPRYVQSFVPVPGTCSLLFHVQHLRFHDVFRELTIANP